MERCLPYQAVSSQERGKQLKSTKQCNVYYHIIILYILYIRLLWMICTEQKQIYIYLIQSPFTFDSLSFAEYCSVINIHISHLESYELEFYLIYLLMMSLTQDYFVSNDTIINEQ